MSPYKRRVSETGNDSPPHAKSVRVCHFDEIERTIHTLDMQLALKQDELLKAEKRCIRAEEALRVAMTSLSAST